VHGWCPSGECDEDRSNCNNVPGNGLQLFLVWGPNSVRQLCWEENFPDEVSGDLTPDYSQGVDTTRRIGTTRAGWGSASLLPQTRKKYEKGVEKLTIVLQLLREKFRETF